jgi:hypothetical protein
MHFNTWSWNSIEEKLPSFQSRNSARNEAIQPHMHRSAELDASPSIVLKNSAHHALERHGYFQQRNK